MIDLFVLHVLASERFFSSPIVLNTDQHVLMIAWNPLGISPNNQTATGIDGSAPVFLRTVKFSLLYN
jgi:hypothetical protein